MLISSYHKKMYWIFATAALLLLCALNAVAGTGGTEFSAAEAAATGAIQGAGGRLIIIIGLIIGTIFAAATQRMMAALGFLALTLIISFGPTISSGMISGVI